MPRLVHMPQISARIEKNVPANLGRQSNVHKEGKSTTRYTYGKQNIEINLTLKRKTSSVVIFFPLATHIAS